MQGLCTCTHRNCGSNISDLYQRNRIECPFVCLWFVVCCFFFPCKIHWIMLPWPWVTDLVIRLNYGKLSMMICFIQDSIFSLCHIIPPVYSVNDLGQGIRRNKTKLFKLVGNGDCQKFQRHFFRDTA